MATLAEVFVDAQATLRNKPSTSFATWAVSWLKQENNIEQRLNLLAIWKRAREAVINELFKNKTT